MATKKALEDALGLVFEAERKALGDAELAITEFDSKVQALIDSFPSSPAPNTPVYQFLVRLRSALAGQTNYELGNLKSQYTPQAPLAE